MLLRMLRAKDSRLKTAVIDLIERQDRIRIPIRTVEEQKELADIGFYCLGDVATNAVPAYFVPTLQTPSVMKLW